MADLLTNPLELKGGTITFDPRLDRVEQFDERSRSFPITATIEATKPRSYTWAGGPVTDQGREGACVGHGWTGDLTARPVAIKVPDPASYATNLYRYCQQIDEWPGEAYSGTSVIAGAKTLQTRGFLKEYRWAFGLDDLVLAVGYKGPAVLGIPWYESMYSAPGGKVVVSGRQVGGHCILARGVNVRERWVLLRNSWGADWGVGGDARISFDDLARLLNEGGEACIPVGRQKNAI